MRTSKALNGRVWLAGAALGLALAAHACLNPRPDDEPSAVEDGLLDAPSGAEVCRTNPSLQGCQESPGNDQGATGNAGQEPGNLDDVPLDPSADDGETPSADPGGADAGVANPVPRDAGPDAASDSSS